MTDLNENNVHNSTAKTTAFMQNDDNRKKLIIGTVIVVLALLALGFAATRSLPGGMLYDLKTRVIENLNESVQAGDEAKAAYQAERMRERLEELKTIGERGNMSPEALDDLRTLTTLHTQTLKAAATLDEDEIPSTNMLRAISDFSDVAAAMETISEREEPLQEFGEHMEDVRREAVNLYQDHVDRFAERETPENIYELVRTFLTDVSNEINNAGISENTIDDAEVYINRVGPAMAAGDYPRAITAIAEAKRFIMIEKYGALVFDEGTQMDTATSSDNSATTSTTTVEDTAPISTPDIEAAPAPQGSFGFPD